MAIITVGDQDDVGEDILEIMADRIRGAVTDVAVVHSVQVGKLMSMDDALDDIKRHIEDSADA